MAVLIESHFTIVRVFPALFLQCISEFCLLVNKLCVHPVKNIFIIKEFFLPICRWFEIYRCSIFVGLQSSGRCCGSACMDRADKGSPRASDQCLMPTSLAAGWIRLASLCGCMCHISNISMWAKFRVLCA